MLETRRNGRMLAPWTYTSEELCELEIDHIFRHQWILAGHISELTQTGDYLTFNLAKERAVLVRDESVRFMLFTMSVATGDLVWPRIDKVTAVMCFVALFMAGHIS